MSLTQEAVSSLRSILEQRRARLRSEARADALCVADRQPGELIADVRDTGDEALATQMSDFNISALEKELRDLRETEAALARIHDGTYGECQDCCGEIPLERLRAYPWARRCTHCQGRYEAHKGRLDPLPSL